MGTPHDRVHARFLTDLQVTMRWRRNVISVRATDASDGGVFIRCDEQPAIRELVRLEFTLPQRAEVFAVHGMPVNSVSEGDPEGREAGIGVQFYGLDREAQRVWGAFIEHLRRTQSPLPKVSAPRAPRPVAPPVVRAPVVERAQEPEAIPLIVPTAPVVFAKSAAEQGPAPQQGPARGAQPEPAYAAPTDEEVSDEDLAEELPESPSSGASLELEIASEEDLYEFYMRDVAAGGMFILSDVALPEGERLTLFIRHPLIDDTFELEAVVRSATEGSDGPGLEVEFVDLTEPRLDALRDFIERDLDSPSTAPSAVEEVAVPEPPPAWQQPFDDGRPQGKLAQLFDPWTGDTPERPWSKPPPEDEFDTLFDALASGATGVRHSVPAPSNEEIPDFLMAIPSWSKLENPSMTATGRISIELDPADLVEVRDERVREALRAHEESTRAPVRPLTRAR